MKYAILLLATLLLAAPLGCDKEVNTDDGCECAIDDSECTEDWQSLRLCLDECMWTTLDCDYICMEGNGFEAYSVGCFYDGDAEHDSCLCDIFEW